MNQCNKSFLVEKNYEKKKQKEGHCGFFIFFAARGAIWGINDKVGGVGSHDLNNSPTKWPISGPVIRSENGQ